MSKRWLALALAGALAFGACGCEKKKVTLPSPPLETVEPTQKRDEWEEWKAELAKCVVSGAETDYEVIAKKMTEQYAQVVRERPQDAELSVLDAQPVARDKAVFDAYYGADDPNFQFIIGLYVDVEPEKLDNWHVGTFLEDPNPESPYPTYRGWAREASVEKGEDGNWHLTGMGTGGGAAKLPFRHGHPGEHPGFEELMEAWFVTAGWSHNFVIPYNLDSEGYSAQEVLAEVDKRPAEERPALLGTLWAYVKEYGEGRGDCNWKASDFLPIEGTANIDVMTAWLDEGLWEELTEGQQKLLEELPAEKLPKEAVEWQEVREIWEDTLIPMCYDEKNDVTLYAVTDEDSAAEYRENGGYWYGAGILLRVGDRTRYYPIGHAQWWTGGNPLMVVKDWDGDGKDEAAVSLFSGHGTGVSVSVLYVFDLETLEYETMDFSDLNIPVGIFRDETEGKTFVTLSGAEEPITFEVSDLPEGWEMDVCAGNVVRYEVRNGRLACTLGLDFGGRTLHYLAELTGRVYCYDGRYTLGSVRLKAVA